MRKTFFTGNESWIGKTNKRGGNWTEREVEVHGFVFLPLMGILNRFLGAFKALLISLRSLSTISLPFSASNNVSSYWRSIRRNRTFLVKRSINFPWDWGIENVFCSVVDTPRTACMNSCTYSIHMLLSQQDREFISSSSELRLALWLWPIECGRSNILGLPSPGLMRTVISFFLFKLSFLETSWHALRKPKQHVEMPWYKLGVQLSSQPETSANY